MWLDGRSWFNIDIHVRDIYTCQAAMRNKKASLSPQYLILTELPAGHSCICGCQTTCIKDHMK